MMPVGSRRRPVSNSVWAGTGLLIVLSVCFLLGALIGLFCGAANSDRGSLADFLTEYFQLAMQGEIRASFLSVLWSSVRWPLAVLLLGYTVLGVGAIPVIFLIRGFLLVYTMTNISSIMGVNGAKAAAVLFGITALLEIPVLFLLGCECLRSSFQRLPGCTKSDRVGCRPEIILPGVGFLAMITALQWTVSPVALSAICIHLFS